MDGELWVVDRIEDGQEAVLVSEEGEVRILPASDLPAGTGEGDALRALPGDGRARYAPDREATARLRKEADELRSSLRRGPSGDLSL